MNITCYDSEGHPIQGLTQWDKNRTVGIDGLELSTAPKAHLFNACSKKAFVVNTTLSGSKVMITIPNELLQYELSIVICVYKETSVSSGGQTLTEGQTICSLRVPVAPRAMPENYQ